MRCAGCDATVADPAAVGSCLSPYDRRPYRRYRCGACGLEFWEPRVLARDFYEREVFGSYARMHRGGGGLGPWTREFFRRAPRISGRLLDVGCGDGAFLEAVTRCGVEGWGLDLDRSSVEVARGRRGLKNVYAMTLEEFAAGAVSRGLAFEAVTCFEVLEHQPSPREFLASARGLLAAGGLLAGSVPNRRAVFQNTEYGHRFYTEEVFPPHHFLWFDAPSLRRLLEDRGFERVAITPSHWLDRDGLAAAAQALVFGGAFERAKNWTKRRLLARGAVAMGDAEPGAGATGWGTALTVGKLIVNAPFYPVGRSLERVFNRESQGLYFEAWRGGR